MAARVVGPMGSGSNAVEVFRKTGGAVDRGKGEMLRRKGKIGGIIGVITGVVRSGGR